MVVQIENRTFYYENHNFDDDHKGNEDDADDDNYDDDDDEQIMGREIKKGEEFVKLVLIVMTMIDKRDGP